MTKDEDLGDLIAKLNAPRTEPELKRLEKSLENSSLKGLTARLVEMERNRGADRRTGYFDDLTGAEIYLAHLRQTGEVDDELTRIDALTPFYKNRIELELSPQQRKILVTLVGEGRPLRIREIAEYARLGQQNRASAQLHKLVKKGYLERVGRGTYWLNTQDSDFERFCVARWTEFSDVWTSEKSKKLIPDREKPISYFILHRSEISSQLYQT